MHSVKSMVSLLCLEASSFGLVKSGKRIEEAQESTYDEALLTKLSLDFQVLDSGCCGMAGSFGFEKDHYDVSIKVGERVLLPAVREADKQTLIVADGFSCREQIEQTTDRQALHIAQVLQMALHNGEDGQKGAYPEAAYTEQHASLPRMPLLVGSFAVLGTIGVVGWKLLQRMVERDI